YLMSDVQLLDNEFLLLKEDTGFSSPISVVFYEYYTDPSELNTALEKRKDQIQCVVGSSVSNIPFGSTQKPELWDYADGVDTLDFLSQL
ncbi:MAG: acyl-CoA reductase, partial [Flavobacteriaceae bacterium]|nr:acyl-CoA reductase [Flavobacteriaceae bacterium]